MGANSVGLHKSITGATKTLVKPSLTNVKPVHLDLQISDQVKNYDYTKLSNKENLYKVFNAKDNYYRYIFTKEI